MESDSYHHIGSLLRNARTERRLSLPEASHSLHIRVRYLDALEQGRLGELPGLPYVRGYLQAYAAFLDLDKDEILRRFEQVEAGLARKGFYLPKAFSREKSPAPWMIWGGLAMAFVAYMFWVLWLQPLPAAVSAVENFPREIPYISAAMTGDVACLKPQTFVYPPCTMAEPDFGLLPLPRRVNSVMELAQ